MTLTYALATLRFNTQRVDLLRHDHPVMIDYQRLRNEFDRENDVIVVAAGKDPAAIVTSLQQVAARLRARPDLFEKIVDCIDASKLRSKGLYQLSLFQLKELERRLAPLAFTATPPYSWIFDLFGWNLTSTGMALQAGESPERTSLLLSMERFLASGEYSSPLSAKEPEGFQEAASFTDPQTKGFVFSPDKRLAVVRALPVRDPTSFVGLGASVTELRRIVSDVRASQPSVELGLTGLPILEDDEMETAMSSGVWAAGLEFAGVMLVFFVGFRAMRHPMLIQLSLVVAGCWTLGMVAVTVGRLNILSTTFIITLIGMGVDFGVVWLTRFESARSAGTGAAESNVTTIGEIGPGIVSGAVTTTLAFYATMVTDFVGLRDMGWIAGTGILICLFSMITVLPAALVLCSRSRSISMRRSAADLKPAFGWATTRPKTVFVVSTAAAMLLAVQIPRIRSDYNLLHLQATGLPSVDWEHRLMNEMKASGWFMQLSAATVEDAKRLRRELQSLPQVGRIIDVASMIPSEQTAKRPIVSRLHSWIQRIAEARFDGRNVDAASMTRKLRTDASGDQYAARIVSFADALGKVEFAKRLNDYEARRCVDLRNRLAEMKDSSNPEPVTIDDLPSTMLARHRGKSGRWLLMVFPKHDSWDFEPLEAFVHAVRNVDPHATGEPATSLLGVTELVDGFKRSSWLAGLVVFVACWIDLRSLRLAALAMFPLVLGCAAAFGILALMGMTINPANMIALPLILGLGVDFGVHVLHDYVRAPQQYYLNWRMGRALILTAATTIVGFSSLLISNHSGMIGIGVLLSLGVACCSAAALLTLPAALKLMAAPKESTAAVLSLPNRGAPGEPIRQAA